MAADSSVCYIKQGITIYACEHELYLIIKNPREKYLGGQDEPKLV